MSLTHDQAAAAYASGSVAVTAGAGTGKTHMLAERYLHHLKAHGLGPLQVVAVTFTERAAAELRARIRTRVVAGLPEATRYHAELEAAAIGTIHALAARICREHPEAADVAPDFQVLDQQEGQLWWSERLDEVVAELPEALFQALPYATVREVLQKLLADPLTAERAFACPVGAADELVAVEREQAFAAMLAEPDWQAAARFVSSCCGADGDLLEQMRVKAVGALASLAADRQAGRQPGPGLAELCGLDMRGGAKKAWPEGNLAEVKLALTTLRTIARAVQQAGLATLERGEGDERLEILVPLLARGFAAAQTHLATAKRQARLLDFNDLETGALRALAHPEVRAYYAERWQAFLVDEFQDTNPIQAEILQHLTAHARLTVVGDEQQAIYGFRRADSAVFQRFARAIVAGGGTQERLSLSYRTHDPLVHALNQVFAPVLGELHKPLAAHRLPAPHDGPHLRCFYIESEDKGHKKAERERSEARRLALELQAMLQSGTLVHDKAKDNLRPLVPGDIAILSRVWAPLEVYGEALAQLGIPAVHAGGGDLLATREALDGRALLQFLADPKDNLSLVAVLRGPWFAVSDRDLFLLTRDLTAKDAWWEALEHRPEPGLAEAHQVLATLLAARYSEPPTYLLQLADRLTGFTAVLANLPGAGRRLADWRGFVTVVRQLEAGAQDIFQLIRRLRRLLAAEVEFPRPPLEAGNAVSLMTVHASKGLEWPVVVVPDLTRSAQTDTRIVHLDPRYGVAVRLPDTDEPAVQAARYLALAARQARLDEAERRRVAYVALTRARDHLLLSASSATGGLMAILQPGLEAAQVSAIVVPHLPADAVPPTLPTPTPPPAPRLALLDPVGSGLYALPVTALSEYDQCPRRFRFRYVEGHPGYMEGGSGFAAQVGTLVHTALELELVTPEELAPRAPELSAAQLDEAAGLVRRFREEAVYAPFAHPQQRELRFKLPLGRLVLDGVIDAVGPGYVLDYKTDGEIHPEHHRLQLWAYAHHTASTHAHLAYLRHGEVHTFGPAELEAARARAFEVAEGIADGHYEPTPSPIACGRCPFGRVCEAGELVRVVPAASQLELELHESLEPGPVRLALLEESG